MDRNVDLPKETPLRMSAKKAPKGDPGLLGRPGKHGARQVLGRCLCLTKSGSIQVLCVDFLASNQIGFLDSARDQAMIQLWLSTPELLAWRNAASNNNFESLDTSAHPH